MLSKKRLSTNKQEWAACLPTDGGEVTWVHGGVQEWLQVRVPAPVHSLLAHIMMMRLWGNLCEGEKQPASKFQGAGINGIAYLLEPANESCLRKRQDSGIWGCTDICEVDCASALRSSGGCVSKACILSSKPGTGLC